MRNIRIASCAFALLAVLAWPGRAPAQSLATDARVIGLGGAGSDDNIASGLLDDQQSYRSIPIPFGLFQLFNNWKFFDPGDPEFNPARALEYAADPMHITLNRNSDSAGNAFINSLVKGQFSRDLNAYRGFTPSSEIRAQGLMAPNWGITLPVFRNTDAGTMHGIYIGAGPYISLGTDLGFDQNLINIFSSSTDVYMPDTTFLIGDRTMGQAALAITGGYRAKFALPGSWESGSSRDGIHIAANYHYLHGIHYDTADLNLQFDTDSSGLVTLIPTTTPIVVDRTMSGTGHGFALDLATTLAVGRWDFGVGVEGIGNRIDWSNLSRRQYTLESLYDGGDFVTVSLPAPVGTRQVTLPVRYSGRTGYRWGRWTAVAQGGRGLDERINFGGGAEYTFGPLVFRGGSRYSHGLWHGASGVGFNITRGIGIDAAAFQTSTNIEEERRISFAFSVRLTPTDR